MVARRRLQWEVERSRELAPVVALAGPHGTLVRELYGHPDAAMARERIRAAFREAAPVVALPKSHAASHDDARATG